MNSCPSVSIQGAPQVGLHLTAGGGGGAEHHQLHAVAPAGLEVMARLQQQQVQAGVLPRAQPHHVMPLQFVGGGGHFPLQVAPGEHVVPR